MNGKLLVLKTQSKISQHQQLMSRAQNLALDIQEKVIYQLEEGALKISQDRSDLQKFIHQNQIQSRSNSVPHFNFQMSEYSKEDDEKMRQLIRKQKQYEQRLERSARQLEQNIKMDELFAKQKQEEERKKFFQDKKIKVLQSIEQIKQRNQNRKKLKQQENAALSTIKSQKKLHEKLMEKWKQLNQRSEEQKNKLYEKLKEHKKIDFQEIKEHAIRHDETMTKIRSSRLEQSRLSQPEVKKFYQSIYMSRIIEQEQENKQKIQGRKKQLKQLAQKRSQYGEIVRQNYKPKIKQANTQSTVKQIRKISRSLSHLETVHKGNDYMREINVKLDKSNKSAFSSKLTHQKKSEYFKYRNYLTEIRVKKSESQKQMQMEERVRKNTYEKEIKKIMNEKGLNEQQRFNKAKLLSKKFEVSYLKKDTFKLIDTINAKIQILRHVSS